MHPAVVGKRTPSWEYLPSPDLGVRGLLMAEADEAQLLPYQLLGLESPPLPLIFVRQQLQLKDIPARSKTGNRTQEPVSDAAPQEAIPAAEVLARGDHLLITGEPGSGKTALVRELTRRLARIWLREDTPIDPPTKSPLVPLLLSARVFVDADSFTSALAKSVHRAYGISVFTELRSKHFARPMKGSRWLLMIDGVDEVVDQALRVRIIRAIAGHARADAPYRFIVTSRPLPEAELRPLREGPFTVCSVEPFGQAEVQEFANKWFTTQNPATAAGQSRAFIHEISDIRLRETVGNPLLATIAAVAKSKDPELPLPSNRIDLYARLCSYLIGSDANGRTTSKQIRRRTDEPGYRAIEWVHAHREELLEWLAERYLTGDSALLEAARTWAAQNLPRQLGEDPRSADLRHLLTETGLLVVEGTGLRFTHQTLAEYLAARAMARRLPAYPTFESGFKILVTQGLDPARRTFAIFALVLWSRAGGHLGILLRSLLDGPPRHSLLAGRILADCGDTRPAEAAMVVDRIMGMALGRAAILPRGQFGDSLVRRAGRSDSDPQAAAPWEAFSVLSRICGDPHVATRLNGVIASGELAAETRADAAVALGRSTDADAALAILRQLADGDVSVEARVRITEAILALDPAATESAESVLRTITTESGSCATAAWAAQLLIRIGRPEDAVSLAWSILNDSKSKPEQYSTAVQVILRHQAADAVDALLRIADGLLDKARPALRWILVELVRSGAEARVTDFCAQALVAPTTIRWQMPIIAGAWAMAAGPAATDQIFNVLNQRNARDGEILEEMALRFFEAGCPDEAFKIAMEVIQDTSEDLRFSFAPWIALSTVPPERISDVLSVTDRVPGSNDYASLLVDKLVQIGETSRAAALAKSVIMSDKGYSWDGISAALRVLRSVADPVKLAAELALHFEAESYGDGNLSITEVILELGDVGRAAQLAREIIGARSFHSDQGVRMARVLLISDGLKAADEIVNLVRGRASFWRGYDSLRLADCLASLGTLETATKLWTELLLDSSAPIAVRFEACSSLVQSGQRHIAINAFNDKFHAENLLITERARLGALHTWAMLCGPQEHLDVNKTPNAKP